MHVLTNLLFKVTLSSMILTAPAMITGRTNYDGDRLLKDREAVLSFYSSAVIEKFITHPSPGAAPIFAVEDYATVRSRGAREAGKQLAFSVVNSVLTAATTTAETVTPERITATTNPAAQVNATKTLVTSTETLVTATETPVTITETPVIATETPVGGEKEAKDNGLATSASARAAELRMVINQAVMIYDNMNLEEQGLDEKAFEYAWRGYHNMLKKGLIHKRTVLSICDFSQSCCSKRMYVIDVQHRKLLYRTYVAHGQNSGEEYATSFSNEENSFKSSLGFYLTDKIYYGRNGLSLRLNGIDSGYNDLAFKRKIVLHGSTYVGDKYIQDFGTTGTSLGCPALPSAVSSRIIKTVKNGSCLFIYHPTQQYLDGSTIINS